MSGSSASPIRDHFHRPLPAGLYPDPPSLDENPANLFTLPYVEMIDTLTDLLFPPRRVAVNGRERIMRASSARIDRYVLFRAYWQPEFAVRIQLALRDLANHCAKHEQNHFANLSPNRQEAIIEGLESESLLDWIGTGERSRKRCFEIIYEAITEGLLGEPGYGGNDRGLGWQYSNFMPVEDL